MKVSTTHLDYEKPRVTVESIELEIDNTPFNISYVVSQLLFENDTEHLRARLKSYNDQLRWMAEENNEEVAEQVGIEGPALFVFEIPIGKN